MVDDVLLSKAFAIERSVARAREEYDKAPASFGSDLSRQDAAILNIQRACQAALDMGQHLIRRETLGVPQSGYDVFELLRCGGWLEARLLPVMKTVVGFTHIAVHDDQALQIPVTIAIITQHLGDVVLFSSAVLQKDASMNFCLHVVQSRVNSHDAKD